MAEDFATDEKLLARATEIAEAIGAGGLMGRIGSSAMLPPRSMQFADWWKGAGPRQRLVLLSTKDKREKIVESIDAQLLARRMSSLSCPFRGSLEVRVAEREQEEEGRNPTSLGLERPGSWTTTGIGCGSPPPVRG